MKLLFAWSIETCICLGFPTLNLAWRCHECLKEGNIRSSILSCKHVVYLVSSYPRIHAIAAMSHQIVQSKWHSAFLFPFRDSWFKRVGTGVTQMVLQSVFLSVPLVKWPNYLNLLYFTLLAPIIPGENRHFLKHFIKWRHLMVEQVCPFYGHTANLIRNCRSQTSKFDEEAWLI